MYIDIYFQWIHVLWIHVSTMEGALELVKVNISVNVIDTGLAVTVKQVRIVLHQNWLSNK